MQFKAEAKRYNVADCGRRWGKNVLGEERLIEPALQGNPVAWFAPSYKYLGEAWRHVSHILQPVTVRANEQEHRIELVTRGVVEMWTLQDKDAGRGRKYKRAIFDECAMVPDLLNIWNLSLRATLVDLVGDAWFLSTPKGRNAFWQLYQIAQNDTRGEWAFWQRTSYENPHIRPSELDAMRATMPERVFAQEIMAQFLDDAGGVFRKVVEAATLAEQPPIPGHQYVMGVDWGKSNDFTVLTVIDVAERRLAAMDRFNQIDWSLQRGRLAATYARYKPTTIIAETNSIGEPNIEALRAEGLPVQGFTTTNATKAQIIEGLSLAFETSALAILNDDVLVGELQAYELERLPSGLVRYNAPEGMHDDCVMSLALAWWGADRRLSPESLIAF
jgi:hypothetical protein